MGGYTVRYRHIFNLTQAWGLEQLPDKLGKLSQLFLTQLFPDSLFPAYSSAVSEQPDPAGGKRLQILIVHSGTYSATWTQFFPKTNYKRLREGLENSSHDLLFQSMGILSQGETEFSGLGQ